MPAPQVFVTINTPPGSVPTVNRTFQVGGNMSFTLPSGYSFVSTSKTATVQFGPGGSLVAGQFAGSTLNWQCTGTVGPSSPWGSFVTLSIRAAATFRFFHNLGEPDLVTVDVNTTFVVRLVPAIAPTINLNPFTSPIVATQLPLDFTFTGSAAGPQGPIQLVQYKVEEGQFANAVNLTPVTQPWSRFQITLPLPPTTPGHEHTLTIRAIDTFGTIGEISKTFAVEPQSPIVVPPGGKTTFSGAPTTSSITSWTRLEPQCTDADIGTSSGARLFDPLWMLTRQWQM